MVVAPMWQPGHPLHLALRTEVLFLLNLPGVVLLQLLTAYKDTAESSSRRAARSAPRRELWPRKSSPKRRRSMEFRYEVGPAV
jgi:hypothetical protein